MPQCRPTLAVVLIAVIACFGAAAEASCNSSHAVCGWTVSNHSPMASSVLFASAGCPTTERQLTPQHAETWHKVSTRAGGSICGTYTCSPSLYISSISYPKTFVSTFSRSSSNCNTGGSSFSQYGVELSCGGSSSGIGWITPTGNPSITTTTTTSSFWSAGMLDGAICKFRIREECTNSLRTSPFSDWTDNFMLLKSATASPATAITATPVSNSNHVAVSWSIGAFSCADAGATFSAWTIAVTTVRQGTTSSATTDTSDCASVTSETQTSCTFTGLRPSSDYTFSITHTCSSRSSSSISSGVITNGKGAGQPFLASMSSIQSSATTAAVSVSPATRSCSTAASSFTSWSFSIRQISSTNWQSISGSGCTTRTNTSSCAVNLGFPFGSRSFYARVSEQCSTSASSSVASAPALICATGFEGPTCSKPSCQRCLHGSCKSFDYCSCDAGWTGWDCGTIEPTHAGLICMYIALILLAIGIPMTYLWMRLRRERKEKQRTADIEMQEMKKKREMQEQEQKMKAERTRQEEEKERLRREEEARKREAERKRKEEEARERAYQQTMDVFTTQVVEALQDVPGAVPPTVDADRWNVLHRALRMHLVNTNILRELRMDSLLDENHLTARRSFKAFLVADLGRIVCRSVFPTSTIEPLLQECFAEHKRLKKEAEAEQERRARELSSIEAAAVAARESAQYARQAAENAQRNSASSAASRSNDNNNNNNSSLEERRLRLEEQKLQQKRNEFYVDTAFQAAPIVMDTFNMINNGFQNQY